ncbi:MAG: response regulator [Nitrospiraceae bacterium]|nr:MAG: response regulator [Nitrospiraceae bacterium]
MNKKILIVDDELAVLIGLAKALRELCGFLGEIRTVVSGREAVYETCNCFYDLCFLDIKLSDINGLDVMKDIHHVSPETNIVLMSASHIREDLKKLIEKGEAFYIDKPFNFSQIKYIIKAALDGRQETARRGGTASKSNRRFKRRSSARTIHFNVKDNGLIEIRGRLIDISYAGMGMETIFPLKRGQVLSLKGVANRRGTVVWSTASGNDLYRAGISFR